MKIWLVMACTELDEEGGVNLTKRVEISEKVRWVITKSDGNTTFYTR